MIIKLIRYLFGYINFRAFGGFSDRFLNLCTRDGIPLWNIQNVKGNISASTTIDGYLALRRPAKKSGMKVMHLEKKGLIFFLKAHKVRVGIFIGIIICALIMAILSQFVWSISLVGNTQLEEDYLLNAFEEKGIYVGVPIGKLDDNDIAGDVVSEIEKLSWAAVNRKGTSVVIEVREKTIAPEMYDDETPTNLIASEDGVIISTDVLYGQEEVKIGSAVTKGDLLISGVITHKDGTENTIHADGYVKALVKRKKTFTIDDFECYKLKSEKKRYSLFFFGIKVPFGTRPYESFYTNHKSFIESEKILLPLGIITEYGAEFNTEKEQIDIETADMLCLYNNAYYVKELLDFSVIKSSNVTKNETELGIQLSFYGECEQEIGVLQEIYVEKSNDNT